MRAPWRPRIVVAPDGERWVISRRTRPIEPIPPPPENIERSRWWERLDNPFQVLVLPIVLLFGWLTIGVFRLVWLVLREMARAARLVVRLTNPRRAWYVEARSVARPESTVVWQVSGFRASGRVARQVAASLRGGFGPGTPDSGIRVVSAGGRNTSR